MTARPPSPDYYQRFVRRWPGGDNAAKPIKVVEGKTAPRVVDGAVLVGADWLRSNGIPREAVETATKGQ